MSRDDADATAAPGAPPPPPRATAGAALVRLTSAATLTAAATLVSGCADRPWTPSISLVYARQDPRRNPLPTVTTPAANEAIARWQLPPALVWSRYQKLTLLAALGSRPSQLGLPDVHTLAVVQRAECAARVVAREGLPRETLWVVDLRGAASVAFGATLSRLAAAGRRPAALVATFNNWPDEYEAIPAEETLAAMLAYQPALPPADAAETAPVFLLDAWRLAERGPHADQEDRTDNRYALLGSDFPAPDVLRAQGIGHVVYLVESLDDTEVEEDDLHATFLAYQRAGVVLHMVDLPTLCELRPATRLVAALNVHPLRVQPRHTLMDDVNFFTAAHGGFGGVRAMGPLPVHDGAMFIVGGRPPPPQDEYYGGGYFGGYFGGHFGGHYGGGGGG